MFWTLSTVFKIIKSANSIKASAWLNKWTGDEAFHSQTSSWSYISQHLQLGVSCKLSMFYQSKSLGKAGLGSRTWLHFVSIHATSISSHDGQISDLRYKSTFLKHWPGLAQPADRRTYTGSHPARRYLSIQAVYSLYREKPTHHQPNKIPPNPPLTRAVLWNQFNLWVLGLCPSTESHRLQ